MASLLLPHVPSATHSAHPSPRGAVPPVARCREILAVEPDIAALNAGSLLLTKANYCVTRVTSDRELFRLRDTKPVALAILSDRLGLRLLGKVAETIRRQWPRTRILILGQVPGALQDYLYDEHICRSSDPKQVLADLESLYNGMWSQHSNTLHWHAARSAQ